MLKVAIIEDEPLAAQRLEKMLHIAYADIEVVAKLDSVARCNKYFSNSPDLDLIFMDIQLADGISFEIFSHCHIDSPVIFTTAYDDYMLQAFKVNSIDYLLKPIDQDDLSKSIQQYLKLHPQQKTVAQDTVAEILKSIQQKHFKERFLIKSGQHLSIVQIPQIAYFISDQGYVRLVTKDNKKHLVEYSLDQLNEVLDPALFFRINRKYILKVDAIHKINSYFNSRLKLSIKPLSDDDIIVSRDRVADFKQWLDR